MTAGYPGRNGKENLIVRIDIRRGKRNFRKNRNNQENGYDYAKKAFHAASPVKSGALPT